MNRRDFIKRAGTATMAAAIMNPTELLAKTEGNMNDIEIQPETKNVGEVSSAKKVLLINGSPRRNGNTATALQEVAKAVKDKGGVGKTIVKVQSYDWKKEAWLDGKAFAGQLKTLKQAGMRNLGYYPATFCYWEK